MPTSYTTSLISSPPGLSASIFAAAASQYADYGVYWKEMTHPTSPNQEEAMLRNNLNNLINAFSSFSSSLLLLYSFLHGPGPLHRSLYLDKGHCRRFFVQAY